MEDQNTPILPPELLPDAPGTGEGPQTTVQAVDEAALQAELAKEKQFGDASLQTAAEAAASSATLGLSDFVAGLLSPKTKRAMAERRDRNPISSALGTAAGIVAPAVLTGGESALAKGAAALPTSQAIKVGAAAETFASKALASRLKSKAAQEIVAKSVGMGTEGALYGVGNLVSEASLGNADFNAENIIASAGSGALLGAGFGAALGAAHGVAPIASKSMSALRGKLTNSHLADPVRAAEELTGLQQRRIITIKERQPKFFEELPEFFRSRLQLKALDTADDLAIKNAKLLNDSVGRIKKASAEIDNVLTSRPGLAPVRTDTYNRLLKILDAEEQSLALTKNTSRADIITIRRFREDVLALGSKNAPFSFKEFDELRKRFQAIKYKGGGMSESFKATVAERLRGESRRVIDDIADNVAAGGKGTSLETVASDLKLANKDFYTASVLKDSLLSKASKATLLKWGDIVEAAALNQLGGITGLVAGAARKFIGTDLRRNAAVLLDIGKQKAATEKLIKTSVEGFFSKSKRASKALSLRSLVGSGYSMSQEQQAPKNKKEAFKNVKKNLENLALNPDLLPDRLAKSTIRIAHAAPAIANSTNEALVRGVEFLQSKVPKENASGGVFKREFEPSSMQLAKFERYLQAVEHPLSVLEDLERGTISREHIEAIKAVYPAIYGHLQQTVLDSISEQEKGDEKSDLSYTKRVELGILLDIPTDESLQPAFIATMQANFTAPAGVEGSAQAGQSPVSGARADKLEMADRSESSVQKTQTRVQSLYGPFYCPGNFCAFPGANSAMEQIISNLKVDNYVLKSSF